MGRQVAKLLAQVATADCAPHDLAVFGLGKSLDNDHLCRRTVQQFTIRASDEVDLLTGAQAANDFSTALVKVDRVGEDVGKSDIIGEVIAGPTLATVAAGDKAEWRGHTADHAVVGRDT